MNAKLSQKLEGRKEHNVTLCHVLSNFSQGCMVPNATLKKTVKMVGGEGKNN